MFQIDVGAHYRCLLLSWWHCQQRVLRSMQTANTVFTHQPPQKTHWTLSVQAAGHRRWWAATMHQAIGEGWMLLVF